MRFQRLFNGGIACCLLWVVGPHRVRMSEISEDLKIHSVRKDVRGPIFFFEVYFVTVVESSRFST